MTDIQLMKTGFKPWLSAADRARLTVLIAEAGALREAQVVAAERDSSYRAAELALDNANAHYRAVHYQHRNGHASDADLEVARQLRDAARQALVHAHNAINAQFHGQRKV